MNLSFRFVAVDWVASEDTMPIQRTCGEGPPARLLLLEALLNQSCGTNSECADTPSEMGIGDVRRVRIRGLRPIGSSAVPESDGTSGFYWLLKKWRNQAAGICVIPRIVIVYRAEPQ